MVVKVCNYKPKIGENGVPPHILQRTLNWEMNNLEERLKKLEEQVAVIPQLVETISVLQAKILKKEQDN